jgi:mannan endo-1,4-beta-mannosidase
MTIPPPEPVAFRRGRHVHSAPARTLGITRITQSSELPAGINALASADGKTIIVRAGLDKVTRRRAVREVVAASHRFPALVLYPALADSRIRRMIMEVADSVSSFMQHVAAFAGSNPTATALAAVATAATAGAATVGVMTAVAPASPPAHDPARYAHPAGAISPPKPIHVTLPDRADTYLGVYEHSAPATYTGIGQFASAIGHQPNIAVYYSGWNETFRTGFAEEAAVEGAIPCVQIDPAGVSIGGIAAGRDDAYLISFARAVHAYGGGVIISFGHEMNAPEYSWGFGHVKPATFIEAWRHIVRIFRMQGDFNVTWLWTVNVNDPDTGSIGAWYPGSQYVTWVGIDGYYVRDSDTFGSIFGQTIGDVNDAAPGKRILIAETAASPPGSVQATQINGLFAGVKDQQILGFVWFDVDQNGSLYRQDWRIENDPAAIAAFKRAAKQYRW